MQISISNDQIKAEFSAKGAELQSLTYKPNQLNYLWRGDADYWGKFSPILFPIVGALKNDKYEYRGQEYKLPRHGFARDLTFDVEAQAESSLVFSLTHNEETLSKYPFKFKLSIIYELVDTSLHCTYKVENLGGEQMLFSIGGHPAFAAPLNQVGSYTDYYLQFSDDEAISYHHIEDNLISDTTSTTSLADQKLFLEHSLFYDDALVIKNLKSKEIALRNTKNEHGLNFQFSGFPYFGIWAAKDADFVCLEPWCGIADGVAHNQKLEDKEGMITLDTNADWQRSWKVTLF